MTGIQDGIIRVIDKFEMSFGRDGEGTLKERVFDTAEVSAKTGFNYRNHSVFVGIILFALLVLYIMQFLLYAQQYSLPLSNGSPSFVPACTIANLESPVSPPTSINFSLSVLNVLARSAAPIALPVP